MGYGGQNKILHIAEYPAKNVENSEKKYDSPDFLQINVFTRTILDNF